MFIKYGALNTVHDLLGLARYSKLSNPIQELSDMAFHSLGPLVEEIDALVDDANLGLTELGSLLASELGQESIAKHHMEPVSLYSIQS